MMDIVLSGMKIDRCLCYLDDVIGFGKTLESSLENLIQVFERLRESNLKLKPKKCVLFKTQVSYLGHTVTKDDVHVLYANVKPVKNWPEPQNVKDVQSFLGLAGYYRRFIPNFSEIASPMTQVTKKNKTFNWTAKCSESFQKLKDLIIKAPILTFPTTDDHFILDKDASANGIGAVLSQIHNGQVRVISYASKTLNQAEKRYCTTKRELLAVVYFETFQSLFMGSTFYCQVRPFVLDLD